MDMQFPLPRAMLDKSKFYNNTEPKTLKNKFETILRNQAIVNLDFLVGYFRISGFLHLYTLLEKRFFSFKRIRILVGLNVDSLIAELNQENIDIQSVDKSRFLKVFEDFQIQNIQEDTYVTQQQVEDSVDTLIQAIGEDKIQMRIVRDKNVHAKFYIFSQEPVLDSTNNDQSCIYTGSLIVGSSNLSENGLIKQYEFNAELNQSEDIETALYEFNQLWEQSIEITKEDIEKIKKNSCLELLTPKDIYYKFLIEYFGKDRIQIDRSVESLFPSGYKAFEYQVDAVTDGINKLEKYNGFFLSDVVGLGKTLIATIIAQKIKLQGYVLIICPPSLKRGWEEHFKAVRVAKHFEIFTPDTLEKITNPEDFELIIVDESHRFKSSSTKRYKSLKNICHNNKRFTKKIMLLSATPQNNSPEDIENQINLFQFPSNISFGTQNLKDFFREIKKEYKDIKERLKELSKDYEKNLISIQGQKKRLKTLSEKMRESVLKYIMIRRTRKDIEKSFNQDSKNKILFPKLNNPQTLQYVLSKEVEMLTKATLDLIMQEENSTKKYGYYRYLIYPNLTPQGKEMYLSQTDGKKDGNFYEQTADRLKGLMKSLMFKRFESSLQAFKETLGNQIKTLEIFIDKIQKDKQVPIPKDNFSNLEAYYEALDCDDEEGYNKFLEQYEHKLIFLEIEHFAKDYLSNLKSDLEILKDLKQKWEAITEDSKLKCLIEKIEQEFAIPLDFDSKKILIFTEATTTAKYLKEKLDLIFKGKVLQVDSSNRDDYQEIIRENFDANYEDQKDAYQILISTDTLAEGVNMHRSNILINYDAPWNATRLMQRSGRINRVGTKHKEIYIYNFLPSYLGDRILKLSEQIFQKLQSFHYTLGEDSMIFSDLEDVNTDGFGAKKTEDDEINEELQYLSEIRKLLEQNPKEFERIALLKQKSRCIVYAPQNSYIYFKQKIYEKYHRQIVIDNDHFYHIKEKKEGLITQREPEKITFLQMAKFLKSQIKNTNICTDTKKHNQDIELFLKFHKEEMQKIINPPIFSESKKLTSDEQEAIFAIRSSTLSSEQKEFLQCVIKESKCDREDIKSILDSKDLSAIIEKYQNRHDEQKLKQANQTKMFLADPEIQISYKGVEK